MNTKYLGIACCFLAAAVQLHSQGYLLTDGITLTQGTLSSGSDIRVLQSPSPTDYNGFSLEPSGNTPATTFLFNPYADEGVRTFLVAYSQPICLDSILARCYTELTFPNTYTFVNGSPFYVAFYTGHNPWDNNGGYTGIYTDPVFGWAKLENVGGVIQLLDSALEWNGGGIYAGTRTIMAVPEPSVFALFTFLAIPFIFRSCKARKTTA